MPHTIKPRFPLTAIHGLNNSELARRTGYALRTIQRWSNTGIPLYSADRLAISLAFTHPTFGRTGSPTKRLWWSQGVATEQRLETMNYYADRRTKSR
jgi:hypothetical protein